MSHKTVIVWFRKDLRCHDNWVLHQAILGGSDLSDAHREPADALLPVFILPAESDSQWCFPRMSPLRRTWINSAVKALAGELATRGCPLLSLNGDTTSTLLRLVRLTGARAIYCEAHAAPEEVADLEHLKAALGETNCQLYSFWQSSLFSPTALPWTIECLPPVFTDFRRGIEDARLETLPPLPPPLALPPWPAEAIGLDVETWPANGEDFSGTFHPALQDERNSFRYSALLPDSREVSVEPAGEVVALEHLQQYLQRGLPHSYKRTRDGLIGLDYSLKASPWLATGSLSPRRLLSELRDFESQFGANEGSYWLWFELLWRDYFRFLHLQHGSRLFSQKGLAKSLSPVRHNPDHFAHWCSGETGSDIVDAGMRELASTGFISNRMRQIVASALIHDLECDWRAGAAWFESQLIDYDVYSNQGNWLYISGGGTDPRGGRRFNLAKQAAMHDPQGEYRMRWCTLTPKSSLP